VSIFFRFFSPSRKTPQLRSSAMVRPGNPDEEHLEKVLSRSVLRQGNTYKPDGPKPVIPLSSGQKRNLAKKTKKHKEAPP
jgi:hypothetical protein